MSKLRILMFAKWGSILFLNFQVQTSLEHYLKRCKSVEMEFQNFGSSIWLISTTEKDLHRSSKTVWDQYCSRRRRKNQLVIKVLNSNAKLSGLLLS